MNERIKELIRQAESTANEGIGFDGQEYTDILMEKFAELIVCECAEIANNKMKDLVDSIICEEKIDSEIFVGNKIKEHFGVEK